MLQLVSRRISKVEAYENHEINMQIDAKIGYVCRVRESNCLLMLQNLFVGLLTKNICIAFIIYKLQSCETAQRQ